MLEVQDGFLQNPAEHIRPFPQFALLPQVPLQELGVPDGVGVPVGVAVGVPVGVEVGVPVGVAVGVEVVGVRLKVNTQVVGATVGVTSWACGILLGTLGATGWLLN